MSAPVIYGKEEQAIQREMVAVADSLNEQRQRLKKLVRRLEGLPSHKSAEEASESTDLDLVGLHPAAEIMGSLELAASNLRNDIADLRRSAAATPARLAATVRARKVRA